MVQPHYVYQGNDFRMHNALEQGSGTFCVINKENGKIHHKMYRIFLHTLMVFYEFSNISASKYDGALQILQVFLH